MKTTREHFQWASSAREGFTLIEIMVAVGICAVTLTGIVGVLAMSLDMTRNSGMRTEAASIVQNIVADLELLEFVDAPSPRYKIDPGPNTESSKDIVYLGENGEPTSQAESIFRVDLNFPATENPTLRPVHIVVSWPGSAPGRSAGNGDWPASSSEIFEVINTIPIPAASNSTTN